MKLKRAAYRHVEAEIYAYHETLQAIRDLRADIILAGKEEPYPVASGEGQVMSQVERRATRLADSILLREMERITGAIRECFSLLPDDRAEVLRYKYWGEGRNRRPSEIADEKNVDESTFRRWRGGLVYAIAEKLGWY